MKSRRKLWEMGRSIKLAVLECERLQDYLPAAVYARTGGYLQLLQSAFAHVLTHASSILQPQISVPPSVSFTGTLPADSLSFFLHILEVFTAFGGCHTYLAMNPLHLFLKCSSTP